MIDDAQLTARLIVPFDGVGTEPTLPPPPPPGWPSRVDGTVDLTVAAASRPDRATTVVGLEDAFIGNGVVTWSLSGFVPDGVDPQRHRVAAGRQVSDSRVGVIGAGIIGLAVAADPGSVPPAAPVRAGQERHPGRPTDTSQQ
jgi:hypothetical protein